MARCNEDYSNCLCTTDIVTDIAAEFPEVHSHPELPTPLRDASWDA